LVAERETLAGAGTALARTAEQLADLARQVREYGSGVRQGTRRQLADHTRDYGRALGRLSREARAGADRRQSRIRELVDRDCALLIGHTRRRFDDARRDASHHAALIAAQDFRRRGWLLASTANGEAVRSATDLTVAKRIHLHLHDGRAQALVEHVNHDPGSSTA
jgi:exonuclease VII large subunit